MAPTYTRLQEDSGEHGLNFDCGELPADAAIVQRGYEPNGHFWESVAAVLAPEVVERVELDSEGSMFSVWGESKDMKYLQELLEPVVSSPEAVVAVFAEADRKGIALED